MDFRGINDNLNTYYDELFTNEYLIKYGYYSYKKSKNVALEEYPNSDVFYHRLFNFDDFLDKINISTLRIQKDTWTEPTYFNIPKDNLLRRQYKLPNIYSYLKLSSFLITNKSRFISTFIDNVQSTSKYFDSKELTFSKQKEIEEQLLFSGKYRLHTDLSNFYPTLYTHSISWMILGKWESKKTFQTNQRSFENRLDKLIQISQYGETHGIPTGNLISRIVAELYMCYFDKRMFDEGFIYKRYVDDFIFAFNNEEEQNRFLEKFNLICRENNLYLNSEKTKVETFPFRDKNDKVDIFNYLELHGIYKASINIEKKRQIIKNYIQFCEKNENEGNKGSLKTVYTGLDIAFGKLSQQDIVAIMLDDDSITGYNLLKKLIDITFSKPELSNRLLSLIDVHFRNHKTRVRNLFTEYILEYKDTFKNKLSHYHQNKFDLERYQILLYIVLFFNSPIFNESELLQMISTDVDDYSLCLLTIIYLQNNFDDNKFLERIKNLFSEVHQFYEDNRSRMTEKLWFFRYFIYILIRNNSKWKKIVLTKYKKSELDYIFILSSGTNEQKSVNKLYSKMLKENVVLVNCGTNFNFKY